MILCTLVCAARARLPRRYVMSDEFMDAMKELFPNLLVQFEDFSTDNAFKYLSRFRQKYRSFNDDVSV
jgi:malic enzyme